jgi:colanic acid/amylovoran biosynthesis glycosyltransferase
LILKAIISSENARSGVNMRLLYRVLALSDRCHYDVIHCQFGTLLAPVLKLRQFGVTDGKVIVSFRGYDVTKVLRDDPAFYAGLFEHGALFLPVSDSLKKRILRAGCPSSKTKVLHSGIDCSMFRFSARGKATEEATRVVSIGRFVEKKGLDYAVEAVANTIRSGLKLHYTIVGDGELREQLERKIRDLGIQDFVGLLGWCEHKEIIRLLEESHILLAPSVKAADGDQEGIPNVLKEAMATGLPVLSTCHSGIPELVENGVTGYLVPERDTQALAERLRYLCKHPEEWADMGRKARQKIEAEFDMEKLNDILEDLYLSVLEETNGK